MIFQWKLVDGLSRRIRPPGSRKQIFWQRLILLKVIFLAVKVSMKVFSCNLWKWTFVKVRKIGVNLHIFLLCFPAFCTVRQDWSTGAFCTAKFCLVTSQDIYFTGLFNIRYFYIVIYHVIFATMGVINQSSWIENRPGALKPMRIAIMNIQILSQ